MLTRRLTALLAAIIYVGLASFCQAGSLTNNPSGDSGNFVAPLRSEDGGLWVKVQINDHVTARMMIDTGAAVVVLPANIAAALDIRDEGDHSRLQTIRGPVEGRMVTLDSLVVGDAQVEDVKAVVIDTDDKNTVGLLGRSFLNHFNFTVDFESNELRLSPRESSAPIAWRGISATRYISDQLEVLRREVERAERDPQTSSRYIARLEASVKKLEAQRAERQVELD